MGATIRCCKYAKDIMKGDNDAVKCKGRPTIGVTCNFCTFNIKRYEKGELTEKDKQDYMRVCRRCPCNFCHECIGAACKCYTCMNS